MNVMMQILYKLQTLEIAGLTSNAAEAAGLRRALPQGMLANYERARARGKKGIALVRNHVCTNCRIQVPVAVSASLLAGIIQACPNCGLYLCLPEPNDNPVVTVAKAATAPPRPKRKSRAAGRGVSI
jgi:predicted  nucleic acid-binding Zn-ribbon protein